LETIGFVSSDDYMYLSNVFSNSACTAELDFKKNNQLIAQVFQQICAEN
jgi:hypothetical protein